MDFGIEKCDMLIMTCGKRQITEGIELPNQERIRTLGEKENYKYLGILETDTTSQDDRKNNKNRRESFSKLNSAAGISLKE